jgi:two-component system, NtrC family, sensor histidine kinase HydH
MRTIAEETSAVVTRLQESQREALRREQLAAAGQLAAGLAHELRNPLMSMKILIQAAAADPTALTPHDLAVLAEEITRLEQLTRTFLDFARPQQLSRRVFDARDLITQTVRVVSGRCAQQEVTIDCRLSEQPLWLNADPAQIRQVLLNLLLNALDAMPGGGCVTVDAVRENAAGGYSSLRQGDILLLRVSDRGPGLPPELGERIFEPFVSTRGTGMGLGLTICRRIIEDHGGTIDAANGHAGGAEFTMRLPLAADAESILPEPALADHGVHTTTG